MKTASSLERYQPGAHSTTAVPEQRRVGTWRYGSSSQSCWGERMSWDMGSDSCGGSSTEASTGIVNLMWVITGSQWRSRKRGGLHGRILGSWTPDGCVVRVWLRRQGVLPGESCNSWGERLDQDLCCFTCEEGPDPADVVESNSTVYFKILNKNELIQN